MEKTLHILKDKRIKVTPQRLGVYRALARAHGHLTAEELHARVKKDFPAVSLGTIYAILEFFAEKGLVQEIRIDFQKSCYDILRHRHHHFQCRKCQRIFDVDIPLCEALAGGEVEGHAIEEFQGYFYGTCRECLKRSRSTGGKKADRRKKP
jgi:Fur family transcriptional regulator, peroxide stress response regulator